MKNKFVSAVIAAFAAICLPGFNFAQVPKLGATENFTLFTTTGAVANTGVSNISGNIGSNVGAITDYDFIPNQIHITDSVTLKCVADLLLIYHYIDSLVPTQLISTPMGSGQSLTPGIYLLGGAAAINLDLILDGQGNPDARFIFKIMGAFSTGAMAGVILINGASPCNVFWQAEGAVSMAAGTIMRGTVIANNGAISMAATSSIEGRLLSTTGAIATDAVTANIPVNCTDFVLPIHLLSLTGACHQQSIFLKWLTASETNNRYFTIERSNEGTAWEALATVNTAGNGSDLNIYSYTDKSPGKSLVYYRLKQTDIDNNYTYSAVIPVKNCNTGEEIGLSLYPNPSSGLVNLDFDGDRALVQSTEIFNTAGQKVFESKGIPLKIDLTGRSRGIYFIRIYLAAKTIDRKIVVK